MSVHPVRIAVAGAGVMGQSHMAVIRNHPDCVLSALVDPAASAQVLARQFGVPLLHTLDELLQRDRPDGIILATPNALHVPQAFQCIQAGLPVLLEKPIATEVSDAQTLVDAVERSGAKLLIGHHRAHSPLMAQAKQLIDSGRLGRLVGVMGSAAFCKPDSYFSDGPWRREPGGGPILINMIHEVHNLRMLCGDIVAVQALQSQATREFAVEDTVVINLRFANGVLGSFLLSDTAACGRSWEQTSQENKAYASYADEDCYVITGTQGSLSVPTMRLKTFDGGATRSWFTPMTTGTLSVQRDDPLQHQLKHFIDVVRGHARPRVTARDGLNNLRVTEAIALAASNGSTVTLSP
jgi:predicted dehydrogenase